MQGEKIMWALIMTIQFYTYGAFLNPQMVSVDGFTSEKACKYAGASQELELRQELKMDTRKYTFICVKKD